MSARKKARQRIGRVSLYEHHGGWWLYYRREGSQCRQHVGASQPMAECEASLLNAELAAAQAELSLDQILAGRFGKAPPTSGQLPAIPISELRQRFLEHHDRVLASSLATIARYSTATLYLERFAAQRKLSNADSLPATQFIEHLRTVEVTPNGHANTARRRLRDKGISYILECCRSMYHFGIRHGIVSREPGNPFSDIGLGKLKIRDAKPIFVFTAQQEAAFFQAARAHPFVIHFTLARTGLRPGELVHLLIEDLDLPGGWLQVRSKAELGWITKTARERRVPLIPEVVAILRYATASRSTGLVFQRPAHGTDEPSWLEGDRYALSQITSQRLAQARAQHGRTVTRHEQSRIQALVWKNAGAVEVDRIRTSFMRTAKSAGLNITCPKSWRHTFATLLQEANVDLLVRQETLGHKPAAPEMSALGMTGVYTHTTPEFQRREIERALRLRPQTLEIAQRFIQQQTSPEQ